MLIGNITKRPEIAYFSNSEMTGNYFVLIPRIKVFLRHNLMHILWVFFTFKAFPGMVWDLHIFVRIIDQCYITMYIPCSCYQGFFLLQTSKSLKNNLIHSTKFSVTDRITFCVVPITQQIYYKNRLTIYGQYSYSNRNMGF